MIYDPLNELIFVDLETTGFSEQADEILSLTAINGNRTVLFDMKFKPEHKTSWDKAQAVNGISPESVKDAPSFRDYKEQLRHLFYGKIVLFYNADFDSKFLRYELSKTRGIECVMKAFAEFRGIPNPNRKGYNKTRWKWHKLAIAMEYFGIHFEGKAHTSRADTLGTVDVFLEMVKAKRKELKKKHPMPPHDDGDYVLMNTLGYLSIAKGEIIGVMKNTTALYCKQLLVADYNNPEHILLCKAFKGGVYIPVIMDL